MSDCTASEAPEEAPELGARFRTRRDAWRCLVGDTCFIGDGLEISFLALMVRNVNRMGSLQF